MGAPTEPVIIAEHGGLVIAQSGAAILVIDRGTGASRIAAFVLSVVTLVCGGFGAVAMTLSGTDAVPPQAVVLGAGLLAVGIVAGVAALFTVKAIRESRRKPLSAFVPVAVFDRAQRVYRDGTGAAVAPLDQVRFERRMQIASSSPKLVAVTPARTDVLKRGNPFGGGIGDLDQVLTAAVQATPY
ncbi:MAG: hypothetical protein SW019_09450 [Actinomycetota bacterium]|nr:hypothetical protein [Actinomycetota bacterium]